MQFGASQINKRIIQKVAMLIQKLQQEQKIKYPPQTQLSIYVLNAQISPCRITLLRPLTTHLRDYVGYRLTDDCRVENF